ncbi:MAG TPA: sensor histidine kinase [Usitatibacteraceae bacterium]|nr:sensor histidine kinase [Usitatibacteraceae bacterium]
MASISHRPETPDAPTPAPTRRLPNFCNMGIMLRMLVIVNALCLAAAAVRGSGREVWQQFLLISVVAQPAIIASLLGVCAMRPLLARLQYWQGVLAILVLEALIGAGFFYGLAHFPLFATTPDAWQFALFFGGATAVVLYYFDLRSRALSPALIEARLQALQARIRPHFLFNSINAVLSLIRSEPRRAERMLEDMSDLFRVLMADNRKLVPLADEIALCRKYLEIEQIRLGERLQVEWDLAGAPARAMVPPLILQPLLENAVYHGIEPREGTGTLAIEVQPAGKQFCIRLSNPYHSGSSHVTGNRMAIANIKERLQLHFDAEASLAAEVRGDLYVVTITLPAEQQEV